MTKVSGGRQEKSRRKELFSLLGDLPSEKKVTAKLVKREEFENHILETLVLSLNGREDVPAYYSLPKKLSGKVPALLFNHSHGSNYKLGKDEFVKGNSNYLQTPPYAEALAKEGWASLAIDHWCFGERSGKTESATFKEMLWNGQVLWGMMVYDSMRAIDYLGSRKEVDAERIGTLGLSMGSTMAWWLAALDERIKVCVDICCLTDFHALIKAGGLDGHGIYYYVPSLLKHFSSSDINALIAPRAHLALAGNYDGLTPKEGLDTIDRELKKAYAAAGASDKWKLSRYGVGHMETAAMRLEIMDFIRKNI